MPDDDPSRVPDVHGVVPEDENLDREAMSRGRDALFATWCVFEDNFRDWLSLEEWLNKDGNHLAFWSTDAHPSELFREPSRRLHNFLASATTLIDHTRNHLKRCYSRHSFYERYQAEVDAVFKGKPNPEFIIGLRNFALHNRLPLNKAALTLTSPPRHAFLLERDLLLTGDRWTSASRAYLTSFTESFEVTPLIIDYREQVTGFQRWLSLEEQLLVQRSLEARNSPNSRVAREARGQQPAD